LRPASVHEDVPVDIVSDVFLHADEDCQVL